MAVYYLRQEGYNIFALVCLNGSHQDNSNSCERILMKFLEGCDVSLATSDEILFVIWIRMRIVERQMYECC